MRHDIGLDYRCKRCGLTSRQIHATGAELCDGPEWETSPPATGLRPIAEVPVEGAAVVEEKTYE